MKRLKTSCAIVSRAACQSHDCPYLDGAHVCVLGGVLVLVQAILCEFALAEIDTQFDKQDHHRLERGDGAVAGALGGDMFVEELEGSLLLLDSDEFLGTLAAGC